MELNNQLVNNKEKGAETVKAVGQPAPDAQGPAMVPAPVQRTPGLKIFDLFLYPFLTNFVVFGMSVGATYLTNKGGMRNAKGELIYGKIGDWFHHRGKWMADKFKKMGMSSQQADMSKMVVFSWVDGTAIAPMVKLLEDRREDISKWVDDKLGTTPADEVSAYRAEPKQSWLSVIGGRLLTASIVVPTAVLMDKLHWNGKSLNDKFFNEPGQRLGEWMAKKPEIAKHFGKLDIGNLGKVGVFEAFYTSVCTAGLYVSSRFLARVTNKKKDEKKAANGHANGQENTVSTSAEGTPAKSYAKSITPASDKVAKAPAATYAQQLADSVNNAIQPIL
jgi:hypothetical protein